MVPVTPRGVLRLLLKAAVLAAAFLGAYMLRFDGVIPSEHMGQLAVALPVIVVGTVVALHVSGVSRQSWQYTSLRDAIGILATLTVVSLALLAVRVGIGTVAAPGVGILSMPFGVIGGYYVLSVVGLLGLRMARRLQAETSERNLVTSDESATRKRVVLIGAGRAGLLMARELQRRPDLGLEPVGFLDDDPSKRGRRIGGLDVLGSVDDVVGIARDRQLDLAVITIAALGRQQIRHILQVCEAAGLATKIVPGVYEIVGGDVRVSRIRDVDVADLLGRDQVELDDAPTKALVADHTVLVTGAGGSIGSELVRQVARLRPARLLLVERAEPAMWAIHREVVADHPDLEVVPLMADVCDRTRMDGIFAQESPDVVIHAAAHKHVPMMEANPGEAVKNNIGGTRTVVDLAAAHGVERFVLISTDKAVNPTSVMGATKRLSERYVQHVADATGLHAVAVRFGNVLGSTGSVVPIFREQVAAGGPVTVTHPDMQRYFMTIPEAATLVLQAGALGQPGEVLVLDMGEPVRIVELAESVIRLSGMEPYVDITIEFSGLRPGEKLYEELSLSEENATRTRHAKIWIGAGASSWTTVDADLAELALLAEHGPSAEVVARMAQLVPTFRSPDVPVAPTGCADGVASDSTVVPGPDQPAPPRAGRRALAPGR